MKFPCNIYLFIFLAGGTRVWCIINLNRQMTQTGAVEALHKSVLALAQR